MISEQARLAATADARGGRRAAAPAAHRLVFPGGATQAADPLLVGHKFARQARLLAAGYRVPEFVCVSVEAFDAVRAETGIGAPAVRDSGELAAWAARARARVRAAGVPDALAAALLEAYDRLTDDGGTVMVRSCAVPARAGAHGGGEEAAPAPGGGFPVVGRDELVDRVSQCWASAFTTERVLDRFARGGDPAATRMAVGIQRLVRAERSFVAVSRDLRSAPDTADQAHLAAAYGLGEGVTGGRADVDHFSVDVGTGVVELRTVRKTRRLVPADTGGTTVVEVPEDLAHRPVLDVQTARRIARLARGLESHFGGPQEIEGAITADGEIHLVQARPAVVTRLGRRRPR
ncbi:hypothetical protein GCM10020229_76180 [Kitasatospora albolonga]|uniref:PEP/pyruvate-binding domain-containing protein n=1 Tax=Kitasatospora albolonga TaxID=68173 RepID=UPI0031EE0D2D